MEPVASPVTVRLRGLMAIDDSIAWASGREGTVLRTLDGGRTWSVFRIVGAQALDFRDIHAFDSEHAVVMSAGPGDASRLYRTADGGRTWTLVLRNPDADGFFDCMDFRGDEGRLLGDPVDGRFQVFSSRDAGRSWDRTKGPKALPKEAAFAASGTCLRRLTDGTVLVTGGAHARVLYSPDRLPGEWRAHELPAHVPADSSGLFSIAEREGLLLSVGGDFQQEARPAPVLGVTARSEVSRSGTLYRAGPHYLSHAGNDRILRPVLIRDPWFEVGFEAMRFFDGVPSGYRSSIACQAVARPYCVATGPSGNDLLGPTRSGGERDAAGDGGTRILTTEQIASVPLDAPRRLSAADFSVASAWLPLPGPGYDSVSIAGRIAWFSGDGGRIARMELPPAP